MGYAVRSRSALGISLAVAFIAGCSAQNVAAPLPQVAMQARAHSAPQRSRIESGTSTGDLVYLAAGGQVQIRSYPAGKYLGRLSNVKHPIALCSDTSGNVWVVDVALKRSNVLKYAHDGTTPTMRLQLEGHGSACAVDPSTGNLAVGTRNAKVAVWANGQAAPTLYSTRAFFKNVQTLSYDGSGNLYMRSFDSHESGAWLAKGGSTVEKFDVAKLGSYGWDGQYFLIGPANGFAEPMKRYDLSGGKGTVVGQIRLKECATSYMPSSFSVAGSALAVSCGLDETNSLNYYNYPQGGKPIETTNAGASGSVAISTGRFQNF